MSKKNYEKSAGIALAFVLGVILIFTIIFPINVSAKTLVHEQSIVTDLMNCHGFAYMNCHQIDLFSVISQPHRAAA